MSNILDELSHSQQAPLNGDRTVFWVMGIQMGKVREIQELF